MANKVVTHTSKRVLAILALTVSVIAVALTGYNARTLTPGERLLAYIPHDTVFLLGTLRGLSPGGRLTAWRTSLGPLAATAASVAPASIAAEYGPGAGLIASVIQRVAGATTQKPGWPLRVIGLPRSGVLAGYTVAGVPVLRWQLAHPRALRRTLAAAEHQIGRARRTSIRGNLRLWRFPFGAVGDARPELIIASGNGFALAAAVPHRIDEQTLDAILGLTRPRSRFDPSRLQTLAAAHGLVPGSVGLVDNERLVEALLESPDSFLDELVADLAAAYATGNTRRAALSTPACRKAARALIDYWPGTAFGIPAASTPTGPVKLRVVAGVTNQRSLAVLERFRGQLPRSTQTGQGILSIGLGLDLSQLRGVAGRLDENHVSPPRPGCRPFAAVPQWLHSAGDAALTGLGSATSMPDETQESEIRGIAATALSGEPVARAPWWLPASGWVTLATESPEAAWRMIWPMLADGTSVMPAPDGAPVALPDGVIPGVEARVAARDGELALLIGRAKLPVIRNEDMQDRPSPDDAMLIVRYRSAGLAEALEGAAARITQSAGSMPRTALTTAAQVLRRLGLDLELRANVVDAGINVDVTGYAPAVRDRAAERAR